MPAWISAKTFRWKAAKAVLFAAALTPFAHLLWRVYRQDLGPNPLEFITHATGDWTLRFLLITLAVTPLRRLLGMPNLIRFRRMFGLFAFFYGCLHLTTYLVLDKGFDFNEIVKDVAKRPFITAGVTGLLLMLPLAITSTAGWIRTLGGKNWQRLHRLAYFSALAGVVHYYWLVKSDVRLPLLYAAIFGLLMAVRAGYAFTSRMRTPPRSNVPSPRPFASAR
jgi:methionine sulfoxide reductase heme-binding subunit